MDAGKTEGGTDPAVDFGDPKRRDQFRPAPPMPIYGIMFVAGLGAGLLFTALAFAAFVIGARGGSPGKALFYFVGMILLSVGAFSFFLAWEMTHVRIPPGG